VRVILFLSEATAGLLDMHRQAGVKLPRQDKIELNQHLATDRCHSSVCVEGGVTFLQIETKNKTF